MCTPNAAACAQGYENAQEWLEHLFQSAYCAECGLDHDAHRVIVIPPGLPFALCTDPIPENLTEDQADAILAARLDSHSNPEALP